MFRRTLRSTRTAKPLPFATLFRSSLPRFDVDAPAARTADVVELYNQASRMFAPEGMRVRELSPDRRGSWSLLLSNGTRVHVGSQESRLRLARFARLMPNLRAPHPHQLARPDPRHTHGSPRN